MKILPQAPFVRFLIPFLAGIITAVHQPVQVENLHFFITGLFLLPLFFFRFFFLHYKWRWINGSMVSILFFLLGYQFTIVKTEKFGEHHFSNYADGSGACFIKVIDAPREKEKSVKIKAAVMSVQRGIQWINTTGKALVYFRKNQKTSRIKYGDCLFLDAEFNEINPPQNPGEFDYKRHMALRNIFHRAYAASGSWMFANINDGNPLVRYALSLREKLLAVFKKNNIEGDEYAVGSALILGYEDKLEADIISAYSATGALHVLSVSGLHVAIVYIIFDRLLIFFEKLKKGNIIKSALLILLIWFYALLTGLSPSVLRAAAMFSFIIVGKSLNRYTNIYNTLAASCFLLLLFDPYLVMDVGFQLSYLAVAGIVFLQDKIYQLWDTNTWLMDQVWKITAVSIAAQLATFPIGLFYFHQFPNYFLLSNLIVIPLSSLVLYFGILLFTVSGIGPVASLTAMVLKYLIYFLNESVQIMERFPHAIVEGVNMSITETCLVYSMLIFIVLFLLYNRVGYLRYFLFTAILLTAIRCIASFSRQYQRSMIVYNVPNASACDFINGREHILLADSALMKDERKILFHVKPNWCEAGLTEPEMVNNKIKTWKGKFLFLKGGYIQFFDKKIILVSSARDIKRSSRVKADYLILAGNVDCSVADLVAKYNFDKLIIDSSNSRRKAERWLSEAEKMKISCYSVIHSGAFTIAPASATRIIF